MHIDKLSLSYRCHRSIGNSLKLDEMIHEVLSTFIEETYALTACYYKYENTEPFVCLGKRININHRLVRESLDESKIVIKPFDEKLNLVVFALQKGYLLFVYDSDIDLEFIVSIYESFRTKLDISIDSCLNVMCLEQRNQELKDLSENLQNKVDLAVASNKKKEKQIFEQLKMSQMGELIGNIAHQWRQPLSIISTATSGMKLKKELNMLTDESFHDYTDSILNNVQFLSKTIDEFRDYIKESHKEKEIIVQERVRMAVAMLESSCELENISIIEEDMEVEPIRFRLVTGELLQVLISIFNNAKEALIQSKVEQKQIKYAVKQNEFSIVITIEDNGGGIDENIIDKIFNPYFTTKHKSQGTGIGLYTSYDIITNHLDGKLYVVNTAQGAKFYIELPIFMDYSI